MIRRCNKDDLPILREISRETYRSTFAGMNTEANMNAYLEKAFSLDRLEAELLNEASFFFFAFEDHQLAGYLKLNDTPAQTDLHDPSSLELERIYVAGGFQGKRLGYRLIKRAVDTAKEFHKSYLWLGVWEKNEKALEFYRKNGFYPFGTHSFVMGDDVQRDFLLRKDLMQ